MPPSLFQYLQAPVPFFVGLDTNQLSAVLPDLDHVDELVVVDLDDDEVRLKSPLPARLPQPFLAPLVYKVKQLFGVAPLEVDAVCMCDHAASPEDREQQVESATHADDEKEDEVSVEAAWCWGCTHRRKTCAPDIELRLAFLNLWHELLRGYRHFVVHLPDGKDSAVLFDCPSFVHSKPRAYSAFLTHLLQSHSFSVFLEQRIGPRGLKAVCDGRGWPVKTSQRLVSVFDQFQHACEVAELRLASQQPVEVTVDMRCFRPAQQLRLDALLAELDKLPVCAQRTSPVQAVDSPSSSTAATSSHSEPAVASMDEQAVGNDEVEI